MRLRLPRVPLYRRLVRPLLFLFPPELAHGVTSWLLRRKLARVAIRVRAFSYPLSSPVLSTQIAGLNISSPVGLAAGYDKNCEEVAPLMDLGFGYVVGGTVMYSPQPGNPAPRLTRISREESMINSMGFPSKGVGAVQRILRGERKRPKPLVISVSGHTQEEMLACHAAMEPFSDAIEINISSPNTASLKVFRELAAFAELLEKANAMRSKPLFIKLPFYSDPLGQERVLGLVRIARDKGLDGVTASNASLVSAPMMATGWGGLSGRALFKDTLRIVKEVRAEAGESMVVNGLGGIFTAEDAFSVLEAGADTIQLLTGLVYEGPGIAAALNRGLAELFHSKNISSVTELTRCARIRTSTDTLTESLRESRIPV
ncbi:MAG: dihydroorotate dehydrogenase (quinone) [SAR202 cluster bacterium Io17-Chloro-G3]|nr:MAG: dihydroorotate dehydrogenase (quinone) [SAR202 cluster bacterium Io17-Chloro-G3]